MKKFLESKTFLAVTFFCAGFMISQGMNKISMDKHTTQVGQIEERYPVSPEDVEHDKLVDAFGKKQMQMLDQNDDHFGFGVSGIKRSEDEKYVYYEIPLMGEVQNKELKVNIKDGMISISENSKNSQSQREFSIEPGLDEANAIVLNDKDKLNIKIPKRKRS
jgi:hypothetical protein